MPNSLFAQIKTLANKLAVPHRTLLKLFLADRIAQEWKGKPANA